MSQALLLFLLHRFAKFNELKNLSRFFQRPDGSWRPAKKVKEGYVPPEDIGKFVCKAEREYRQRTQYVVGSSSLRREPSRGTQSTRHFVLDFFLKEHLSPIFPRTILRMIL